VHKDALLKPFPPLGSSKCFTNPFPLSIPAPILFCKSLLFHLFRSHHVPVELKLSLFLVVTPQASPLPLLLAGCFDSLHVPSPPTTNFLPSPYLTRDFLQSVLSFLPPLYPGPQGGIGNILPALKTQRCMTFSTPETINPLSILVTLTWQTIYLFNTSSLFLLR